MWYQIFFNVKAYYVADDLEGILNYPVPDNFTTSQKSWVLVFTRKHIDDSLEQHYLQIEDPADFWRQQEAKIWTLSLPKARTDWANLGIYDFSYFSSYNSKLFKIVSQLHLCGEDNTDEDVIEKMLSTFPTATALLA